MSELNLVSIAPSRPAPRRPGGRILLLKPPYFTPWTPPLGIAILKTFMESRGYPVTCFDFNTDPELWGMHHKYFSRIQTLEDVSISDGYSKLWWILNAHLLAYANGATPAELARLLEVVIPLYGIRHDTEVIDALLPIVDRYFWRLGEVADALDLSQYSVVGTSTYTTSLASSLFLLKRMKGQKPGMMTVMGGGIFADDLALGSDNLDTLVAECPYIDHVVLGEGEMLFLKLVEGELSHKRVISIADLRGAVLDIKDVPTPDFSDLDVSNYYHLSIEGARSCPFQCSFCSETIQWGDYRRKPTDIFVDQVTQLSEKFNTREFFMGDSLMNPYINPFALELIERKAGILYDGYLRADKPVTNRKFVKLWADSGLFRVRLGIESAATRVLDSMDKMTTPQVISDVLKTLASAGIRTTTYWIVGFPGETEQDFQETCDFIKAHHPYIYELEAHPYYYYPYGQVGSRLYQSYSLYPEEVTRHTKFKAWEIVDADPAREVRYERLRRLSKLAADLGLPNIYSMTERYQAEDRWHTLQPLAAEVYQDTHAGRKPATPPGGALEVFSPEAARAATSSGGDGYAATGADGHAATGAAVCYRATVSKRLDAERLAAALAQLVNYNEALQVSLQGGKYVPVAAGAAAPRGEELLSVHQLEGADEEGRRVAVAQAASAAAAELRPGGAGAVRAVLFTGKDRDAASELLLLAHRGVADARSVGLLFEDLFRIYEQLSAGRKISLRAPATTYAAFMQDFAKERADARPAATAAGEDSPGGADARPTGAGRRVETSAVNLDRACVERLHSKALADYGLTPTDVVFQALLRSLAAAGAAEDAGLDLRIDYRFAADELRHAAGALTRTFPLPPLAVAQDAERADLLATRQALTGIVLEGARRGSSDADEVTRGGASSSGRLLFNFEYCVEAPWLGGDQWSPRGFVLEEGSMSRGHLLEVAPVEAGGRLSVQLKHRGDAAAVIFAEAIAGRLPQEVDAILRHCESYVAAREFWLEEFGKGAPKSDLHAPADFAPADFATPSNGGASDADGRASFRGRLKRRALEELSARCDAEPASVMLAAYAVLLGSSGGLEDLSLVARLEGEGPAPGVPVRLRPSWSLGFRDFARETGRKLAQAHRHGAHAFDILTDDLPRSQEPYAPPQFDAAYLFGGGAGDGPTAGEPDSLRSAGGRKLKLTLAVTPDGDALDWHFRYDRARYDRAAVEKLADSLTSILAKVGGDVNLSLEDAALDREEKVLLEKSLNIEELDSTFSF